jgi:hypothetical protein
MHQNERTGHLAILKGYNARLHSVCMVLGGGQANHDRLDDRLISADQVLWLWHLPRSLPTTWPISLMRSKSALFRAPF